jgi:ribosome-associated protein
MSGPQPPSPPPEIVPDHELVLRASRAGGPGGQHVNTSSTRVEIRWNVRTARNIDEATRRQLIERLGRRVDRGGWLRVVASTSRSQHQNRADATQRLRELVADALKPRKRRRATRVPRAERTRRLLAKRRRSETKRDRRRTDDD